MRTKSNRPKVSDLLMETRKFDEAAETITEIIKRTGMDRNMIYHLRDTALENGEWEEVYKHGSGGKVCKAYRPSRKTVLKLKKATTAEETNG